MDELHHFTSGMKSVFSQQAMDGLLVARQSVGGAGYTAWSGLPFLVEDFSPTVTFEGDNTVMAQQSCKYLIKLFKQVNKGKKVGGLFTYLNELPSFKGLKSRAELAEEFTQPAQIDEALKVCSLSLIDTTLRKFLASGASEVEKTNYLFALDIVGMAQHHIKYLVFVIMRQKVEGSAIDPNLKTHLMNLCSLMGLVYLKENLISGYNCGYFRDGASALIDSALELLLKRIRPQAINLAELFGLKDEVLVSAIGNSYGDIYETHFEWAKTSRLNTPNGNIAKGWMENMMPILKGKL
uniref:Acyl-CoA oxidase n=1 Tax=Strombidium rassoulzadegani TaxID=1082188 RepID=A0A7S3CNB4_9SPIT|mmetsp:Transcript_18121/g.30954  ORF Transcript_18121/g.30954 Transcript_18121/m.30954 type:complete len:295 (+) Transcript_18121:1198-2082(+)